MNIEEDPLAVRLDLISHLLKQYQIPKDGAATIQNDLSILHTFALAKDWIKVKIALERWNEQLKDAAQVKVVICKWNVSIEAAIDGSDIEFLKLLLPFMGKHKYIRIKLSFMAIALEKQDHNMVELMIKHLYLDKDENSILARLPKDQKKGFQVLFNRYCCVSDQEILKELLEDFKDISASSTEAAEIAKEHRLAMLTYICHNSTIKVADDTIWNCINSGNVYIAKFLETLKEISVIGWMEEFNVVNQDSRKVETGERPNTPLYHTLNSTRTKNPSDDEQYSSLLALYSAYGGKLSGIDAEVRETISKMKIPNSPRAYTGFLSKQGAPKRFRSSSTVPSQSAIKIVQSKQDDFWTKYLKGETDGITSLPWMEPLTDSKSKSVWNQDFENIAEDPNNAIFEGLAGVASRTSSMSISISRGQSSKSIPILPISAES